MDYGQLLRRAWDIIWSYKFLIILGVLVALASGGSSTPDTSFRIDRSDLDWQMPRDFRNFRDFRDLPEMPRFRGPDNWGIPIAAGILGLAAVGVVILIGLALWVISTFARGGLIDGVNAIAAGGSSSFSEAFGAGWQKGWRLLGIGILPAIPGLILFIGGVGLTGTLAAVSQILDLNSIGYMRNLALIFVPVLCIAAPLALVLNLLRTFANRACMTEDLGVFAAYKRGWEVLIANLGPALVLFVIQIGISIAIGLLMTIPSILMALCCILWPVLLAIKGLTTAYYSAVWTLAWRDWTAEGQINS